MRLATLGVAVILLVGMSPALAHGTQDAWDECSEDDDCENGPYHSPENGNGVAGSHTINESVPYKENLTVENDAYLKAGWWADGSQADGLGLNLSVSDEPAEEEKIMWVHIKPGRTTPSVPYEVEVETEGPVVAAMDVFRVYRGVDEGATWITPDCPQTLVVDLFPDEGEGAGFVFRVHHETTNHHQRSVEGAPMLGGEMSADLNPNRAPEGYIVAVYPQVATANENVAEVANGDEETRIDLTVSISEGEFKLFDDRQDRQQPSEPYDTNNWVGVNKIHECVNEGLELPPPLSDSQAAEIPGQGGLEERMQALVGTSLEAAS